LQDEIPPLTAAEAVSTLMSQPPDLMMQQVGAWAVDHSRSQAIPLSDLIFHALKKVFLTGELKLLDREAVANYLDRVTGIALRLCPTEDRDMLRTNLTAMRVSRNMGTTALRDVAITPRPAAAAPTLTGRTPVPSEDAQMAKRFSLIVDRLKRQMDAGLQSGGAGGSGAQAVPADPQAIAQLLTMAAARSQSSEQLNEYLEQIKPLTGGKEGNVFIVLGGAMPSWDLPDLGSRPPAQVDAMEKILDLAEDPAVIMHRFRDLVLAAVQKFNDGSLAATVWMLDVAHDSITEKKLDLAAVDRVRAEAAEGISSVQLRKYAETRSKQAALRIALGFFPTLQVSTLFQQLRGEPRAERRRTLLGLLEAHAGAGRQEALAELARELARPDLDTYYLRNLIFLLHRIPRDTQDGVDRELDGLTKASARGQNIYVVKEAVTAVGMLKSDYSARLLTQRLAEFEALLIRNDTSSYPADEVQKLLDRVIASLGRIGTPAALLTVARHGMKANALLGDTRARLSALAQHDLSFDEATVTLLVKTLKDEIPGKLLGRLLPKKQDATVRLIEALSGTRSAAAEEVLRDIVQRFPDQDVGQAAARALEKYDPPKPPPRGPEAAATLTGELEFFGLPSILQTLAEMRATGMLTLRTKTGEAISKLVFIEGKFLNAQTGNIRGADAVYEILERPAAGSFAFVPHPPEKMKSNIEPREVMSILLEGVRRHDELQRIMAMVPDHMILTKTGTKPTPHEEETDPALVREVWMKASSGMTVIDCERQLETDAYRIRRLVAHWLEMGALVAASL
jgi:hypothetical protein